MEATVETSYRRGEEAYPESPSASTLWRRVQEHQPALEGSFLEGSFLEGSFLEGSFLEENPPEEGCRTDSAGVGAVGGTCVADATRIPAREEEQDRQAHHSLSIAHVVRPDPEGGPGGRPALKREPVAARVGSETRLRTLLKGVSKQIGRAHV